MSDAATRFEADLEAFLAGRPAALGADAGALALAQKLAGLDLAAESRVRTSLRARLVSRARRAAAPAWSPFSLRLPAGLAAAFAAAVIFLLVVRPRMPAPPVPAAPTPSPLVALAPSSVPAPAGRPALKLPAARAEGVFISIPAGMPFETHGPVSAGAPFVTVPGRRTHTARGRAVVWEFGHATFRLEDRPVRIDELFVKPTL
ncbi:MAG: hypothetical protein NTY77_17300 [Elusimicrobia bacterium]|nr:hypothetical protein [Elusimicrobiota bacterium]